MLLVCGAAAAQEGRPKPQRKAKPAAAEPARTAWPIESISIEGLKTYTREQVLPVLGLHTGQLAAKKDFEAAQQRLVDTGAFDGVGFRYAPAPGGSGYAVTYEVTEAGPRFAVVFEDLGAGSEELAAALKKEDPFYGPTIPATAPLLKRYSTILETYLASHNKPQKVTGRLEPGEKVQLVVAFRPAGALPAVARVKFTGNSVVPSTALENAINAVAIGLPYKEWRFRELLATQVTPVYETRGRVRVAYPEITTEPEKGVKGLVVTVKVDEGVSYSLGTTEVLGTGLPPRDLKKVTEDLRPGAVFNRETVEAGIAKVEKRMRRDGFMHVKTKVERRYDDTAHKADLTLRVDPGPKYTFGNLDVQGLDLVTEPAIRKMWGVKSGEPFNAEYPDYFLSQVRDEGVLDNLGQTKAVQKPNDELHTVDVTLYFKGEPPKPKEPEKRKQRGVPY